MPAKYRADHIGSFLRPGDILQARGANVSIEQLRALEDKHILRVIERQKDLGFKIFTDGELRRGNFMSDFNDAVEGIDEGVAVARTWQTGTGPSSRPSMVPGTLGGAPCGVAKKKRSVVAISALIIVGSDESYRGPVSNGIHFICSFVWAPAET